MTTNANPAPRVLELDAGALERGAGTRVRAWSSPLGWLDRVGRWSGSALGLALIFDRARQSPAEATPLVVAVGDAVRRGMPTAERASLASRAPLTGLYSEGLVGGDFARRLASCADAIVIEGRASGRGAVLVLDGRGARTVHAPELCGASPARTHAALRELLGPCASLAIGPAGERELPIASLAASGDVPHFVGRGGLGAVLGRAGLKAIAITAPPRERAEGAELASRLLASPRLQSRASGGTLELFEAFAERGELRGRGDALDVAGGDAQRLVREIETRRGERHGCQGCPTPCGWSFRRGDGGAQSARFGASQALGPNLGLASFDDALALLADCDELGVDAKEVGAGLALLARARESGREPRGPAWGDLAAMRKVLRAAVSGSGASLGLERGAVALARELDLDLASAKGAPIRRDASLASVLGQCVSSRGGDPMRTFPFLAVDGADLAAFRASTGLELPPLAGDPRAPDGKGRLVAWHEDWANALDCTGFCAFSAASLLADGLASVADLGERLAPRAMRESGLSMLDAGGVLATMQRRLNELWGVAANADRPEWTRESFDRPGAWDGYSRARGLTEEGRVSSERWRAVEELRPWRVEFERPAAVERPVQSAERRPGRIRWRVSSTRESDVELALPCTAAEAVEAARASGFARLGAHPAVFRDGVRLAPDELVRDGDRLALLEVVAGG